MPNRSQSMVYSSVGSDAYLYCTLYQFPRAATAC